MNLFDKFVGESLIKDFEIGDIKFQVKIISKKEHMDIVNESLKKEGVAKQVEDLKIRTLSQSLQKIDGHPLEEYDDIKKRMTDKVDAVEAAVQFLESLPNSITNALLVKYQEVENEYNKKFEELKKN